MTKIIPFHPLAPQRSRSPGGGQSSIFNLQSSILRGYNGPSVSTQLATILQEGRPFLVGEWLVEPTLNRLTRGEVTVQLESKAIDVLLCLVEHAGEVVGKDDAVRHRLADRVRLRQHHHQPDRRAPRRVRRRRPEPPLHRDHPQARLPADRRGSAGHQSQPRVLGNRSRGGSSRRTRSATPTRAWPPSPRPTPTASSAARPRLRRCGGRSPPAGCWR